MPLLHLLILAVVQVILIAGLLGEKPISSAAVGDHGLQVKEAGRIGAVQGLCLLFRGLSRSGVTFRPVCF